MTGTQIERLSKERSAIREITRILISPSGLPERLERTIQAMLERIEPAASGSIYVWDRDSGRFRRFVEVDRNPPDTPADVVDSDLSHSDLVFKSGNPRIIPGAVPVLRTDGREGEDPASRISQPDEQAGPSHAYLVAPIMQENRKVAILLFTGRERCNDFSEDDLDFSAVIASLVSLAIGREPIPGPDNRKSAAPTLKPVQADWVETLSHQLGMPLTAIKGYATALLLDEVDWSLAKRREFLLLIEDECDQIETLLAGFLKSLPDGPDQFSLEPQLLQLPQLASAVSREMERLTTNHRLIVDFPSNFPIVQADPHWLQQVIRNLLDNAIKYSPDGGLVVIRGEIRPSSVVVCISDQGIGISPEDLAEVFSWSVRGRPTIESAIPGSGLGLSIARAIVEAHGGHIWAESKINQGTTLSFSLPIKGNPSMKTGGQHEPWTHSDRR